MSACISGVLVRAHPDRTNAAAAAIDAMDGAEVAWRSDRDGKIVVVLETPEAGDACDSMERIRVVDGVVDVNLSYSYSPN